MSFLSSLGHTLGGVLKTVAPVAAFVPGLGPIAAAAGEGLGQLMSPGGNIGKAAVGAGTTYLGSKLASGMGYGGAGAAGAAGAAGGAYTPPDMSYNPDTGQVTSTGGGSGSPGGLGGLISGALGYLGKNPGVVQAGMGLIGGALQGNAEGQRAQAQLDLQKQQLQTQQAPIANQLTNQIQASPMRDRALYMLTHRAGMAPSSFQPNDIFNGGSIGGRGQQGGTLPQMQQVAAGYTPGAGGVSDVMRKALLARMGGLPS